MIHDFIVEGEKSNREEKLEIKRLSS